MSTFTAILTVTLICIEISESNVAQCYFCPGRCEAPMTIMNCKYYYHSNETRCVSAKRNSLVRRQCMDLKQAENFCASFYDDKAVTCRICNDNLCNHGDTFFKKSSIALLLYCYIANYLA